MAINRRNIVKNIMKSLRRRVPQEGYTAPIKGRQASTLETFSLNTNEFISIAGIKMETQGMSK